MTALRKSSLWLAGAVSSLALFANTAFAADDWEFKLSPYLLFPYINGDTSVGRVEGADIDVTPSDVFDALDLGGMIQGEVKHSSGIGLILNYAFMDLSDDAAGPAGFVDLDAEIFQGILEATVTGEVYNQSGTVVDTYIGIRWWDMDVDLDINAGPASARVSQDENWVDPIVGVRFASVPAEDWRLLLQGDIGGFQIESDFTWNIIVGGGYDINEWFSLFAAYRALGVDYSTGGRGTSDRFAYNTITHGPLLGAQFRF